MVLDSSYLGVVSGGSTVGYTCVNECVCLSACVLVHVHVCFPTFYFFFLVHILCPRLTQARFSL